MKEVIGMHDTKSSLSQLVQRAAAGEVILIGPRGHAEAKLVAVGAPVGQQRQLGLLKGKLQVPSDFDEPLTVDVLHAFEGNQSGFCEPLDALTKVSLNDTTYHDHF